MDDFCTNCGAPIPAGAKFCPRCGTAVGFPVAAPLPTQAAATPSTTLPARSRVTLFVGVPITLIVLGIAVWALLARMPFSNDSKKLSRTAQPAPAVINEQPGSTATTSQIRNPGEQPQDEVSGAGRGTEVISTTTTALPAGMSTPPPQRATRPSRPVVVGPAPPPATVTLPAPAPLQAPPPQPLPAPPARPPRTGTPAPAPAPTPPAISTPTAGEITDSQAEDILLSYVALRDYYHVGEDCVGVVSQGYKNRGYTIDVVDRCGDRGRLGRWRVDSLTRVVFVERGGRYLRP